MNHVNRSNKEQGFTLIELILAMAFLSVLLLAIAMTVIQIGNTYNRGVTLKDVNQAGRSIVSDLQRSIGESAPFPIEPGVGTHFINNSWGGRLCIGKYSYIWNYGSTLNAKNPLEINKYDSNDTSLAPINFVKVVDANSSYCWNESKRIDPNQSTELLTASDHNLAIQSFNITSETTALDSKTGERLYSLSFYLGTNETAALKNNGTACKNPGEDGADIAYCSVQEFDIVIRAGSSVE